MKIAVIGTGYVGVTTAVSFAMLGHKATGIDIDQDKIARLKQGIAGMYEPGLSEQLTRLLASGGLVFTTSLLDGIGEAEAIFVCVGTPAQADGSADLRYVHQAVADVRKAIAELERRDLKQGNQPVMERLIVIKSTVPIGITDQLAQAFQDDPHVHVVSNPEFLREGSALEDALHPARIVIGADSPQAFAIMDKVYAPLEGERVRTTRANAEMIKYGSNAFLATKISFMNELARLCAKVGADVTEVAYGMGLDTRIGTQFLRAGLGYGGSCFPKDTSALTELARRNGVHLSLLDAVQQINESQPAWFVTQLKAVIPDLSQTRIAVLGLSFKPETDDLREAASLRLIPLLLQEGAQLVAFDPLVNDRVSEMFADVEFVSDPYEALDQADCALLVTEWKVCVELDFSRVKNLMRRPLLFDGRNAWPLDTLRQLGFTYLGVGRA